MRPSWIEIDLDAVQHNVEQIGTAIAPSRLCAVVKADAYGHGDIPVAEAVIRAGAEWLAVALVEEAVRLREADIDTPILVLSEPRIEDVAAIVAHDLVPTVYRIEFAKRLAEAAEEAGSVPYPVHLKLDTGMHRVGAPPVEAFRIARWIHLDSRITLQGLSTHFSVSESDAVYTGRQNTALVRFAGALASEGINPPLLHAANTAAALDLPDTRHDLCRVGLGLYGLRPDPACGSAVDLRPAMRVVSHVAYVLEVPAGARPSYGRRRPLDSGGRVATVPIGYADGVNRRLTDTGEVLIGGKRYPYAGTVTMDMIVVDLGSDDVAVGDEVVLLGKQGEDCISADAWAEAIDTITWEIVCGFGPRLPRRYIGGTSVGE